MLPEPATPLDPSTPIYLDASVIETPSLALTCAARETLHMGDLIETMLRKTIDALMTDDRRLVVEIERMDNAVDRLHEAIKLYVTKITRESLDEGESRRAMEIIAFAINLEHIGDIIDKNLMELAAQEDQEPAQLFRRGRRRAAGVPPARARQPQARASACSSPATSRSPANWSRKKPRSAKPSAPRPKTILPGCAKG